MGYSYKTKIARNPQCCLHRNEAARVIGRGGCCYSERYDCSDWHDIFSHGLLLVEAIDPLRLRTSVTSLKTVRRAVRSDFHITKLRECSACGHLLTASWQYREELFFDPAPGKVRFAVIRGSDEYRQFRTRPIKVSPGSSHPLAAP